MGHLKDGFLMHVRGKEMRLRWHFSQKEGDVSLSEGADGAPAEWLHGSYSWRPSGSASTGLQQKPPGSAGWGQSRSHSHAHNTARTSPCHTSPQTAFSTAL